MADKLSESIWISFTKDLIKKNPKLDELKPKLDDKALVSALKEFDKTDESKPEPRLKALEVLVKQIPEQVKTLVKRKKELGDKPFGELKDKLYDLLQDAESQHKSVTARAAEAKAGEAKAAQAKGKGKADEEEEEETPALLTSKMIPLLRELKKGEAVMPCLIALAGKETVVLISRRAISPARGKLLKEQMDKPSGLKFIRGECQYEKSALTFVVQSPGAALAKRLRQALLDQTEMRWKVRVRGEDGVEEVDGEEDVAEQEGVQAPKAPPGGPASAEQLAYTQRLRKVQDRYDQALRERHPEATKLRALMGLASEKADEQKNYAAAIQTLQALEKVLDAGASTTAAATATAGGVDPDAAFKARLIALLPRLKEAQAAGGEKVQDVKLKVSEAGVFARKKDFVQANRLLDEFEELMEGTATAKAAEAPAVDPAAAFNARVAALLPNVKMAQTEGAANADEVKLKVGEAGILARKSEFAAANALLDEVDKLLGAAPAGAPESGSEAPAAATATAAGAAPSLVRLQQSRLRWDGLRKTVQTQLQTLEADLLAAVKAHNEDEAAEDHFDDAEIAAGVRKLHGVLQGLDTRLIDTLDEALNAEGAKRAALQAEAATLVKQYQAFVDSDEMVSKIDDNGFTATSIRAEATKTLSELAAQL